jgi:phosphoenolpyruvate phosphomutase
MYLAKDYLNDDILLLHGDLVIDPDVITDLVSEKRSIVTVDSLIPLPEKDFKAKLRDGRIESVGIEFFGEDCVACQPAYKFIYADFQEWMNKIADFCSRGETRVYAENALNNISDKIALYPLELNNRLCNEVDNINDLKWVSNIFKKHYDKWRL